MTGSEQDDHGRPTQSAAADQDAAPWVAKASGGWDAEFAVFYQKSTKLLVGFLRMHGANVALAADLVQETMIVLYRRWPEVDDPRAWAFRTASNRLVRALSTVREIPTDELPPPSSPLLRAETTDIQRWEQQQDLADRVRRLPTRQRQVMAWWLYGYTPTEIAKELSISADAVRSNLYQARKTFKAQLARKEEDR